MEYKFPMGVFPIAVQKIITSLCQTLGFHVDYIAGALLVAFSTAIGKSCVLEVKETWQETPSLFLLLVGSPGVNKSAPLSFALKPLEDITERAILSKNGEAELTFDYMFSTSSAVEVNSQIVLSNATPEAIFQVMSEDNIRNILYADEAASIFLNFGRYSKGSDTEYFLSFWSGKTVIINRKGHPPIIIRDAFLTLSGTIQPDVLRELFTKKKGVNDGLQDRIIFINPDSVSRAGLSTEVLDPTIVPQYKAIINKLLEIEMPNGKPNVLRYTEEASNAVIEWSALNAKLINDEEDQRKQGIRSKMEIYLHRLALISQLVYSVTDGEGKDVIGIRAVGAARDMAEYFYRMGEKTLKLTSLDPVSRLPDDQQKILLSFPEEFKTADMLVRALKNGMSERTYKYLLAKRDLFKKVKTGFYERLY